MFKAGDKVIFIGDDNYMFSYYLKDKKLIYGNVYTVFDCDSDYILISEQHTPSYKPSAFVSLKEYRKKKLIKICSECIVK